MRSMDCPHCPTTTISRTCPERSEHVLRAGAEEFLRGEICWPDPARNRGPDPRRALASDQRFGVISHAHTRYRRGSLHAMLFPAGWLHMAIVKKIAGIKFLPVRYDMVMPL